jgi:hypothetical protein
MKKSARLPRQVETRRFSRVRRLLGASAIVAIASTLAGCATGVVSEANSDAAWEGARPRPMAMSSSASVARIGSQPLLPPVPEETNGLAPIKISSLTE